LEKWPCNNAAVAVAADPVVQEDPVVKEGPVVREHPVAQVGREDRPEQDRGRAQVGKVRSRLAIVLSVPKDHPERVVRMEGLLVLPEVPVVAQAVALAVPVALEVPAAVASLHRTRAAFSARFVMPRIIPPSKIAS
jgi:hypothetical protein